MCSYFQLYYIVENNKLLACCTTKVFLVFLVNETICICFHMEKVISSLLLQKYMTI